MILSDGILNKRSFVFFKLFFKMFDELVTQDEMKFLRLLLKCDANISQEQKHLKTKLARKDFTDYVEVHAK